MWRDCFWGGCRLHGGLPEKYALNMSLTPAVFGGEERGLRRLGDWTN